MVPVIETERDKRQRERVERSKAERRSVPQETPPPAQNRPQPAARKGDRWAAFNSFMDVIAPRLTLTERAVWLVMFRYARNGMCKTSQRAIANQAHIDKATAGRALKQLTQLGLVWPVSKSRSKGEASVYGLHPRPDARLANVIEVSEQREQVAHARRERNGGDRRGRRRKRSNEPGE